MTRCSRLFVTVALLFTAGLAAAGLPTVDVPGDFATIDAAVAALQPDGGEIVVAPGTYVDPITVSFPAPGAPIQIRSTDPTNPSVVAATILAGDVSLLNTTLDGVSIQNAAVSVSNSTISNSIISPGSSGVTLGEFLGGGPGGDACTIDGCRIILDDTGIGVFTADPSVIRDCEISGGPPSVLGTGGVITVIGGGVSLESSLVFLGESGDTQYGVLTPPTATDSIVNIADCTFSIEGGAPPFASAALFLNEGSATVTDCIFVMEHVLNRPPLLSASGSVNVSGSSICSDVDLEAFGVGLTDLGGNSIAPCGTSETSNDSVNDATLIGSGSFQFSTVGATEDGPGLDGSCEEGSGLGFGADLWYQYVAVNTGVLSVSLCEFGADYDARMAVYAGTPGNLQLIGCADDVGCGNVLPRVEVPVAEGEFIMIRLGGYSPNADGSDAATGAGTLLVDLADSESCFGDLNEDGEVGFSDVVSLLAAWGMCP